MEIQALTENLEHGEYQLNCILPNGHMAQVELKVSVNLSGGYDITIYDLEELEYLTEIQVDYLCVDISDWLLESWNEELAA